MFLIRSLLSAFLMYSAIPVPSVEWKEENRRYSLCFFPLVGAVEAIVSVLWFFICNNFLNADKLLFAAVAAVVPVFLTGGIHLDGFCDVSDAKACFGSREKMLEVMSDSRIGAFGAIHLAVYFILQVGFLSQIESLDVMLITALGFVMSRALSGLFAVTFRCAKREGALQSFSKPAHKKAVVTTEVIFILAVACAMLIINMVCGITTLIGCGVFCLYYKNFAYKKFGGITGDTAGWFLQVCELVILGAAVISNLAAAIVNDI